MPEFEDLLIADDTTDNVGGTKSKMYFVETKYVVTEGQVPASPTTLADSVTISDTHVISNVNKFHTIDVEMDTGELMAKIQGDRGGKSLKTELDFLFPRFNASALGFTKKSNNSRYLVFVPLPDGAVIQMGSVDFPCEITAENGTGKNSSGVRGVKCKAESMANAVYFYTGAIPLTD
jgi:hypothetical protein